MDAEALDAALAAIVDRARAAVAAGRDPAADALAREIALAADRARPVVGDAAGRAAERARRQVARVAAVHRARALAVPATPPPAAPPAPRVAARRPLLRTRATISGNMDVRRDGTPEEPALAWDAAPGVDLWEIRVSERPDPRADYALVEETTASAGPVRVPLRLGERPLRVHVVGRGRGGRPLRRALVSALTRDNWAERWERRASAS